MALVGLGRFVQYEKSRTLVYLSKKVVDDSAFPFKPGERVSVRIEGDRVVLERLRKAR